MAELHVQEKERSAWPWILAAVLLLGLLFWYFMGRDERTAVGSANLTDTAMVGSASGGIASGTAAGTLGTEAVAQYREFVNSNRGAEAAGRSHDYIADGLRRLAAALNEVAAGNPTGDLDVQQRIEAIRERADAIQQNPTSLDHALQTREAFNVAAGVVARLRGTADSAGTAGTATGESASAANADALLNAANAIEPSRPLLEQVDRVERFFTQAAEALQGLPATRR